MEPLTGKRHAELPRMSVLHHPNSCVLEVSCKMLICPPLVSLVENISARSFSRRICDNNSLDWSSQQITFIKGRWPRMEHGRRMQSCRPTGREHTRPHTHTLSQKLLVMVQRNRCSHHMFGPHVLTVSADLPSCSELVFSFSFPRPVADAGKRCRDSRADSLARRCPARPPSCPERCRCRPGQCGAAGAGWWRVAAL